MKHLKFLFAALLSLCIASCTNEDLIPQGGNGEKMMIGISPVSLGYEPLPTKSASGDLLAVQVYDVDGETATPYAKGLFSDWTTLTFEGYSGNTYKVEATMIVDGANKLHKTGDTYAKPFEMAATGSFAYDDTPISGIATSTATLAADDTDYTVPSIDRYYGFAQKQITQADPTIQTSMKRMSFGFKAKGNTAAITLEVANAPSVSIEAGAYELFSLTNFAAAYAATEEYSESMNVVIKNAAGAELYNEAVAMKRNKLVTITVDENAGKASLSTGFDFETPFEMGVKSDNLYYNETQLGVAQNYWAILEDESKASAIKWFVNDTEQATTGTDFTFTPSTKGTYTIKYKVGSTSKEATTKVYSSAGVYILNEPNMTGTESIRGINKHVWGEETVTRFVTGNFQQFGTTNQYIQNWAGYLYNVASYPQNGIAFSRFNAETGAFDKAIAKSTITSSNNYTFAGITPELGVAVSDRGAFLVDLTTFTPQTIALSGSSGAKNSFVADGYLFLIADGSAKAYKIDNLSTETEPTVLGSANTGFVKSKDGYVWAANGGTLLQINPRDLSTQTKTIPNGAQIKFEGSPWKQTPWVASTTDNTFFFAKIAGWFGPTSVYKYDIDSETLTDGFITKNTETGFEYGLYGTSLYFDSQRNELVCQGQKGFGANADYNEITGFNGTTGARTFKVLYDTADREVYPYKDMFFPAMMAPIKQY